MIHILRDPRDAVASMLRMPWASRDVWSNARAWLSYNLAARRLRESPQYKVVRYEQLVSQPENELVHLCAFACEEYSPSMLVAGRDPPADRSWFQRADQPVTTSRLGKWREEPSAEQVALVEWYVGEHMETFGYEAVRRRPARAAILRDLASAAGAAVRKRAGQFHASWYYLIRSANLAAEEAARERFLTSAEP